MGGRGVIFDLDGVLVMSEFLWEEGWTSFAAEHGYAWTPDDTRSCQGMSVPEWGAYLGGRAGADPRLAADAVVAFVAGAYDSGRVSLLPGAEKMVAAVAGRVPIALASSAPRTIIDTVMGTMGLGRYFRVTVSSAEVRAGKPAPDVYAEAARRLGIDPTASYAVEDSSNGVRSAVAAGLTVLAIEHARYPLAEDAAALAAAVCHSLDQVLDQLTALLEVDP
ncbi:haloacid dehalogenase [Acrocarpospora corrugata]|uniref:Haloacid dehalogenase n=1 Tax=Acrocarpospora corrugata TaxID=35763 RepID=A0A5M3VY50_9ACTN|nr:HAD family phosphatase [Acrocarpospora corrugata]GES00652.1 haloacid dehalogenase [Acrocarpospora corrugata]